MSVRVRTSSLIPVALVVALVATACVQQPGAQGTAAPAASASAGKRTITVIANWGGGERSAFQKVIDAFTAKTGIPVNYEQSRNLEALVRTRVAGGNPPDIAFEPRIIDLATNRIVRPSRSLILITAPTGSSCSR